MDMNAFFARAQAQTVLEAVKLLQELRPQVTPATREKVDSMAQRLTTMASAIVDRLPAPRLPG